MQVRSKVSLCQQFYDIEDTLRKTGDSLAYFA